MARKTLSEIGKALDEQLRGVEIDPLANLVFGSDDEASALPSVSDDEPIPAPQELSRSEQAAASRENLVEENYFRLFNTFSPEFERETGRSQLTPYGEALLVEIEREDTEKSFGSAPKAQDPLDEFVEKATDGFVRFLRRRGINLATLAKRAPGSRDGSYVKRGSERERAARTERDGELVSEYSSSGALIRCYESASS